VGQIENLQPSEPSETRDWSQLKADGRYAIKAVHTDTETANWVRDRSLPDRLPGESWFEWSARLIEERNATKLGDENGPN
jgi:hypothetical protein